MKLPKEHQISAARALLGWDQKDLAERVGVTIAAISKIETGENKGKNSTLEKILSVFETANIEFIDGGVRVKQNTVHILEGHNGFLHFFDEMYWTLQQASNKSVYISNIDEEKFDIMPRDFFERHAQRILALKLEEKYKVLVQPGDTYFPASSYAEYRWAPENTFFSVSHYIYGDKIAMFVWEDTPRIYILNEPEITAMHRKQFEELWARSTDPFAKK